MSDTTANCSSVLRDKVEELKRTPGGVEGQAIRWKPANWQAALPGHVEQIERIAASCSAGARPGELLIRRRDAFDRADGEVVALFLASMVWGHGLNGYGPTRVAKIVEQAGERLVVSLEAQRAAARSGPAAAWTSFMSTDRVYGLGPAFATKFAYFSSFDQAASSPKPLIADLNTSWAIWKLAGIPRSVARKDKYLRYVELLHRWADATPGWRADEIEWALFVLWRSGALKS